MKYKYVGELSGEVHAYGIDFSKGSVDVSDASEHIKTKIANNPDFKVFKADAQKKPVEKVKKSIFKKKAKK